MKVSLMVMSAGKSSGQAIPVTLSQFIIGRDPQCNLRPASAVISKRHCAILIKAGKVSVRDFDSTNGTFVNETPVKGEFPLNHEDILKVGPLSFRVVIEKTTPVNKPTPIPAKTGAGSEDDVAAMLLSLQESETPEAEPSTTGEEDENVPGGSTIMDMVPIPPETTTDAPVAPPAAAVTAPVVATKPVAVKPQPVAAAVAAPAKPQPAAAAVKPAAAKPQPAPAAKPAVTAPTPPPAVQAAPAAPAPAPAPPAAVAPAEKPPEKPAEKKPAAPPAAANNARDAARAILEKYMKRPRN